MRLVVTAQNLSWSVLAIAVLFLYSCSTDENIYEIKIPKTGVVEYLENIEARDFRMVPEDSVAFYLSKSEIFSGGQFAYKISEPLYKVDKFKTRLVLKKRLRSSTDYTFFIRTYSNSKSRILDDFILAQWAEGKTSTCDGFVNPNYEIITSCSEEYKNKAVTFDAGGKLYVPPENN